MIKVQEHVTIRRTRFESSVIERMSKAEQNCQTQSAPKHREKSSDLRRRLKTVSDVDEVTPDGRLFHTREVSDRQRWSGASAVQQLLM